MVKNGPPYIKWSLVRWNENINIGRLRNSEKLTTTYRKVKVTGKF